MRKSILLCVFSFCFCGAISFCDGLPSGGAEPTEASPDFDTQIMPVLTKLGCNAVVCHGAAEGKGTLRLSALGTDPAADYSAIVERPMHPLINTTSPEASPLLTNPSRKIATDCPLVMPSTSTGYGILLSWIDKGAKRLEQRHLTAYRIEPPRTIAVDEESISTFRAIAKFNDGTEQDVTAWTIFTPTASAMVTIDQAPTDQETTHPLTIHANRPGRHVIIAQFLDQVATIEVIVPFGSAPIETTGLRRESFIDEEIIETLSQLRIPISPRCDTSTLLRRVYLDLVGRLPSPTELDRFESNQAANAYEQEVDRLLASDAFVDCWTLKFARWLRIHTLPGDSQSTIAYVDWIHDSIKDSVGIDVMARQLLTSTGDSQRVGPANFARMVSDAQEHADLVSEFFLGARMRCASCHSHPVAKWTQDDFHGLAAIFSKIERERRVHLNVTKTITNPRTGNDAKPKLPGDSFVVDSDDARVDFADWLLAAENRYVAKAIVNRLWQSMFGRGLVEPVTDLRDTNPASHPRLHDRLADDLVAHQYSLRRTLRLIAVSETYTRSPISVTGNEMDTQYYSRSYCRPLEPEVLADAIASVTGVPNQFAKGRPHDKAITLYDPLVAKRELHDMGGCCLADASPMFPASPFAPSPQPFLINSEFIHSKLGHPDSFVRRSIEARLSDREIVSQLYLRALCRRLTPEQARLWSDEVPLGSSENRAGPIVDLLWTLLNSYRFTNNH